MKKILALLFCISILTGALVAEAGIVNVPTDYSTIQAGVDACGVGDTVMIAAGTYGDCTHETDWPEPEPGEPYPKACVIVKSDITIMGAGVDQTIINADSLGRGFYISTVSNVRIENLTVTEAWDEYFGGGMLIRHVENDVVIANVKIDHNWDGGVICINEGSPTIHDVDFIGNVAKQGGGLSIEEYSSPLVYNCLFQGNSAPAAGALMLRNHSDAIIYDCLVQGNTVTAVDGGGGGITINNSAVEIYNCQILDNHGAGYGGGLSLVNNASGEVRDCLIQGNTADLATGQGGGVYINGAGVTLTNLTIVENATTGVNGVGGGIFIAFDPAPTITGCTISDNACGISGFGGGIVSEWFGTPVVTNCIISNSINGAALWGGIWDDPAWEHRQGFMDISCCDIYNNEGGDDLISWFTDLGNNFDADPLFCGTESEDHPYGIGDTSPCAPAGNPDCGLVGAGPVGCGTGITEATPGVIRLLGNAPNPFNPKTTIFFVIDEAGPANIRIFDISGRTVATLPMGVLGAGHHTVTWSGITDDGDRAASGVYLYKLNTLGESQSRRMILVK
jgi:hypothetical protein